MKPRTTGLHPPRPTGTPGPAMRTTAALVLIALLAGGLPGGDPAGLPAARAQDGSSAGAPPVTFPQSRLVIETDEGRHLPFIVDLATTPEQRRRGLMFRQSLAADAGMLFVWDRPAFQTMWMKNTPLPLDMLFLDRNGTIVQIEANTTPLSTAFITSVEPVQAILEINAGTARLLAIEPGDRVLHPFLGNTGGARGASGGRIGQ